MMEIRRPKLLVLRFSAMGDVAMVASVLQEFARQQPEVDLIMVSRETFRPFFDGIPNLTFHVIHPRGQHKGLRGLYRLFRELLSYQANGVADLHGNIRSRVVTALFRSRGTPVRVIDKGRKEKKALTRTRNKVLRPLKPTVERYADVFRRLGYRLSLSHALQPRHLPLPETARRLFADEGARAVGIAPFAKHPAKIYPLDRMERVVEYLGQKGHTVLIFGGGKAEQEVGDRWQHAFPNVYNLVGQFTLRQELAVMSHLDLVISMDSAGMHMASLVGVRVLSIWGGTHPFAGFLGYGQRMEDCIQVDHPVRPTSVYGNKPCICDGKNCMELIEPEQIIGRLADLGY